MVADLVFSDSETIVLAAESITELEEKIGTGDMADGDQMEFIQISDEELPENTISKERKNAMNRKFKGNTELGIVPYTDGENVTNTDPNYAIPVSNDSAYQGIIETDKEERWYTFTLDQKSTITIFLQMADTLDADLYICSPDADSNELIIIKLF